MVETGVVSTEVMVGCLDRADETDDTPMLPRRRPFRSLRPPAKTRRAAARTPARRAWALRQFTHPPHARAPRPPDPAAKSSRPRRSKRAAQRDPTAAVASGNAGASVLIGLLAHEARQQPARGAARVELVMRVPSSRAARCRAMLRRAAGLRRQQVARADLHVRRARERRRDAAPVGTRTASTICGSNANRPGCAWMSSVRNIPRWPPASAPCATIASTPRASSQRASSTVVADDTTMHPCAARARAAHHPATRNGSSRRPGAVLDDRAHRIVERRAAGAAFTSADRDRLPRNNRRAPRQCASTSASGAGGVWQKVHVERRACACTNRRDLVAQLLRAERRARASRSPPASHTAIASGPANRPSAPGSAASGKAASSSESSSGKKVVARGCAFNAPDINRQARTPIVAPFASRTDLTDSGKRIIHGGFAARPHHPWPRPMKTPTSLLHGTPANSNVDSLVSMTFINIQVIKYRRLPLLKPPRR